MRKKEKNTFFVQAKSIIGGAFKLALVMAAVMLGMKWLCNALEVVSDHVSVGGGLLVMFAAAVFFVYMDSKNSIEQSGEKKKVCR